jgi:hypothetical protein
MLFRLIPVCYALIELDIHKEDRRRLGNFIEAPVTNAQNYQYTASLYVGSQN